MSESLPSGTPLLRIRKSGYLYARKRGNKSWKLRFFVLLSNCDVAEDRISHHVCSEALNPEIRCWLRFHKDLLGIDAFSALKHILLCFKTFRCDTLVPELCLRLDEGSCRLMDEDDQWDATRARQTSQAAGVPPPPSTNKGCIVNSQSNDSVSQTHSDGLAEDISHMDGSSFVLTCTEGTLLFRSYSHPNVKELGKTWIGCWEESTYSLESLTLLWLTALNRAFHINQMVYAQLSIHQRNMDHIIYQSSENVIAQISEKDRQVDARDSRRREEKEEEQEHEEQEEEKQREEKEEEERIDTNSDSSWGEEEKHFSHVDHIPIHLGCYDPPHLYRGFLLKRHQHPQTHPSFDKMWKLKFYSIDIEKGKLVRWKGENCTALSAETYMKDYDLCDAYVMDYDPFYPELPFAFLLCSSKFKSLHFMARDEATKQAWIKAFNKLITIHTIQRYRSRVIQHHDTGYAEAEKRIGKIQAVQMCSKRKAYIEALKQGIISQIALRGLALGYHSRAPWRSRIYMWGSWMQLSEQDIREGYRTASSFGTVDEGETDEADYVRRIGGGHRAGALSGSGDAPIARPSTDQEDDNNAQIDEDPIGTAVRHTPWREVIFSYFGALVPRIGYIDRTLEPFYMTSFGAMITRPSCANVEAEHQRGNDRARVKARRHRHRRAISQASAVGPSRYQRDVISKTSYLFYRTGFSHAYAFKLAFAMVLNQHLFLLPPTDSAQHQPHLSLVPPCFLPSFLIVPIPMHIYGKQFCIGLRRLDPSDDPKRLVILTRSCVLDKRKYSDMLVVQCGSEKERIEWVEALVEHGASIYHMPSARRRRPSISSSTSVSTSSGAIGRRSRAESRGRDPSSMTHTGEECNDTEDENVIHVRLPRPSEVPLDRHHKNSSVDPIPATATVTRKLVLPHVILYKSALTSNLAGGGYLRRRTRVLRSWRREYMVVVDMCLYVYVDKDSFVSGKAHSDVVLVSGMQLYDFRDTAYGKPNCFGIERAHGGGDASTDTATTSNNVTVLNCRNKQEKREWLEWLIWHGGARPTNGQWEVLETLFPRQGMQAALVQTPPRDGDHVAVGAEEEKERELGTGLLHQQGQRQQREQEAKENENENEKVEGAPGLPAEPTSSSSCTPHHNSKAEPEPERSLSEAFDALDWQICGLSLLEQLRLKNVLYDVSCRNPDVVRCPQLFYIGCRFVRHVTNAFLIRYIQQIIDLARRVSFLSISAQKVSESFHVMVHLTLVHFPVFASILDLSTLSIKFPEPYQLNRSAAVHPHEQGNRTVASSPTRRSGSLFALWCEVLDTLFTRLVPESTALFFHDWFCLEGQACLIRGFLAIVRLGYVSLSQATQEHEWVAVYRQVAAGLYDTQLLSAAVNVLEKKHGVTAGQVIRDLSNTEVRSSARSADLIGMLNRPLPATCADVLGDIQWVPNHQSLWRDPTNDRHVSEEASGDRDQDTLMEGLGRGEAVDKSPTVSRYANSISIPYNPMDYTLYASSEILDPIEGAFVSSFLPPNLLHLQPTRVYSSHEHGFGLSSLYTSCRHHSQDNHHRTETAYVFVIRLTCGCVIGAYSSACPDPKHGTQFRGDATSCVFRVRPLEQVMCYSGSRGEVAGTCYSTAYPGNPSDSEASNRRQSRYSHSFVWFGSDQILFGGGGDGPALRLSASLQDGSTAFSETYGNYPLLAAANPISACHDNIRVPVNSNLAAVHSHNHDPHCSEVSFQVSALEVIGFSETV